MVMKLIDVMNAIKRAERESGLRPDARRWKRLSGRHIEEGWMRSSGHKGEIVIRCLREELPDPCEERLAKLGETA